MTTTSTTRAVSAWDLALILELIKRGAEDHPAQTVARAEVGDAQSFRNFCVQAGAADLPTESAVDRFMGIPVLTNPLVPPNVAVLFSPAGEVVQIINLGEPAPK